MKKTIFHCALLLCAFLLQPHKLQAIGYYLKVQTELNSNTNVWSSNASYWTDSWKNASNEYATQIGVSNGIVYGIIPGNQVLSYWNSTTNSLNSTTTCTDNSDGAGRVVTTDDAGNVIYSASGPNSKVYGIWVVAKSSNTGTPITPDVRKYIELSNYKTMLKTDNSGDWGRTDYWHASGNLLEGNGALWFTDGFSVVKASIVNGQNTTETVYDIPDEASHTTNTPTLWWYQSRFRPYADGKYLLQNYNGLFDCTISNGNITCTKIGTNAMAANIGYLKDHEILVHSKCDRSSGAGDGYITIYDRTSDTEMLTFYAKGNYEAPSYANINAWCEFETVNETTLALYTFMPHAGFTKFLITATTDGTAFTATVAKRSDSNLQDATLSWTMPYQASSVTLQYRKRYIKNNVTLYTNWSNLSTKTTNTTYTHSNVYWHNDANGFYPTTIEYRAIAHYETLETKTTPLTLTAEASLPLIPKSIDWDLQEIVHYSGYQKVQLYWKTTETGSTPKYYNVYRDGVKINPERIQTFNYLDDQIPTGDHEYYIEAFVSDSYSEPIRTTPKSIYVSRRDPMKTTYSIEQIYNKRIGSAIGQVKPQGIYGNFASRVRYKQGQYYKGNWYIAQQYDGNATADNYTNRTTAYGGVMRFSADSTKLIDEIAGRVIRFDISPAYQDELSTSGPNVGIAMDEGGNIFLRGGGSSGANGDMLNGTSDKRQSFLFELGFGRIYLRNSDGSYNDPITVDLSKCQISDSYGRDPLHGIYFGRTDYYQMSGDLSTIGGIAYLWISGGSTYRSNKIRLTRTADKTITATLVDKADIPVDMIKVTEKYTGIENYVFPVKFLKSHVNNGNTTYTEEYRGDYIHQLRSRVYANVKPTNNTATTDTLLPIYDTKGRINNAGGCTIGWNGEIFLITPQCTYSQNSGNFTVAMGDRAQYDTNGNILTDANSNAIMLDNYYADLSKPIPVAQWTQQNITDGNYNDANGNWIYAVHGKIENEEEIGLTEGFTDPGEANCVYIYQYIPGVRFAKYRLVPNNFFPPTPVELEINSKYGSGSDYANPTKDLLRYDGTAKFGIALNNDATTIGNVNYKVDSYTYTFQDVNGQDVWVYNIKPDGTYTYTRTQTNKDGTTTTTTGKNPEGTSILIQEKYTDPTGDYETKDAYFQLIHQDLYRNTTYESTVTVSYVNVSDNTDKHNSETTIDDAIKDYTAINPETPEVKVFEKKTLSYNDYNGNSIKDDYIASFRVELNVNPPTGNEEPVSYYEIIATDKNNNSFKITDFHLMENQSVSETTTSNIPGNYFENEDENEGKWNKDESIYGTLVWFYGMDNGTYDAENNPSNWTYTVNAVYAGSKSASIKLTDTGSNSITSITSTPTEIEEVYSDVEENLRAYPIPAYTTLTVKASETIKSITIYNLMGSEVLYVAGNNDTTMQIDVQSLATGYYIMRVNKMNPIKIIKK